MPEVKTGWDRIESIVCKDGDPLNMRGFIEDRRREDAEAEIEGKRQFARGNSPDFNEVVEFAQKHFPREVDPSKWKNREEMIETIKSCWWHGEGSHGVGGNWWSRVVRPAWEREKGFRK